MKSHTILSVQKPSIEHAWFDLITINNEHLTVYDYGNNITWNIDDSITAATITIFQQDEDLSIKACTITGNKKQIENLMWSLGYAIPSRANDSVYMCTVSELERSLRMALYDLQDVLKSKQDA
jgi:hypothetical protein